ncbi:MAG: N-6 DNA methylase [Chloroflexi bacterium]|nr:N-6 DNA methylase [Chloroflexota bacterium]
MEPYEFIEKWRASELKESSAAQEHFIDLCHLLGEPTPAEDDPTGERYCFERGAKKDTGGDGWADVWKKHCFAWEYKGKHRDLGKAFEQLRQYSLALDNPPLLIVSDMETIRITTNWTNSVSATETIVLEDLKDGAARQRLKWAMSEPERLRPGQSRQDLTESVAQTFASLAQALRDRGQDSHDVAKFLNRLVFCMFAEDVDLLPRNLFTRMLDAARQAPSEFVPMARELFASMASGGRFGVETVAHFNGGLFADDDALPLEKVEIETVLTAARLNWSDVDPSILGTLFERGLDPSKRSQLGAHYTDREKVMLIVEPVVIGPLEAEWDEVRRSIALKLEQEERQKTLPAARRRRREAERLLREFLERLRTFTVLDPACGSGNFLYLALHALKDLEHRVQLEAEALGSFQRQFPSVGPANVKGIEINPYAAELARVSIWIGEIQWMRRNGFSGARDPILDPLETIECRDAVVTPEGRDAEWPTADVVIGNPPFLGNRKMLSELGHEYTENLREAYKGLVRGKPDLVCYWLAKAGQLSAKAQIQRGGLVATNSVRSGTNRRVLDRLVKDSSIFEAWSDEPWIVEGAAVRVSLICFAPRKEPVSATLDGEPVPAIRADLTATGADLTQVAGLRSNKGVAFQGDIKRGRFDIPGETARLWLQQPANPNGKSNADVLMPWINGSDLTRRPRDKWIVHFGASMTEGEAALYELPFSHIQRVVKPKRLKNREPLSRQFWFRHWNPRPKMWKALAGLSRYIATPRNAKHRLFVWCDVRICPDCQVVVVARDDDTTFGILHSRFHEAWSLGRCSWLGQGNDPRYTPTTTFSTFPFPHGLSPDVPPASYAADPRAVAIAEAACNLVSLRDRWLNPPELVDWAKEPVPGYPRRLVARSDSAAEDLKARTLTNLYNDRPQWLADAHNALDHAVAAAYGWPADIPEDEALAGMLALNQGVSG